MKETKYLSNPPFLSDCEVKGAGLLLSNGERPTPLSEQQMNLLGTKHVALKDGKRKRMDSLNESASSNCCDVKGAGLFLSNGERPNPLSEHKLNLSPTNHVGKKSVNRKDSSCVQTRGWVFLYLIGKVELL